MGDIAASNNELSKFMKENGIGSQEASTSPLFLTTRHLTGTHGSLPQSSCSRPVDCGCKGHSEESTCSVGASGWASDYASYDFSKLLTIDSERPRENDQFTVPPLTWHPTARDQGFYCSELYEYEPSPHVSVMHPHQSTSTRNFCWRFRWMLSRVPLLHQQPRADLQTSENLTKKMTTKLKPGMETHICNSSSLGKVSQEDLKFQGRVGYMVRLGLKKGIKNIVIYIESSLSATQKENVKGNQGMQLLNDSNDSMGHLWLICC